MDRGAWQATVHGVAKKQIQLKRLSIQAFVYQTRDPGSGDKTGQVVCAEYRTMLSSFAEPTT